MRNKIQNNVSDVSDNSCISIIVEIAYAATTTRSHVSQHRPISVFVFGTQIRNEDTQTQREKLLKNLSGNAAKSLECPTPDYFYNGVSEPDPCRTTNRLQQFPSTRILHAGRNQLRHKTNVSRAHDVHHATSVKENGMSLDEMFCQVEMILQ